MRNLLLEACVENLAEALAAEQKGAHRLELCADLARDGLSPTLSLVHAVTSHVKIPVKVMVRPRAGGFCYSREEIARMKAELETLKTTGVAGVVLGVTVAGGKHLNLAAIGQLAAVAAPLPVTVHKAIDLARDPVAETSRLAQVPNVEAVLSSGGCETALAGAGTLARMGKMAGNRLQVVAAGKITSDNLLQVRRATGLRAFHGRLIVGSLAGG